MPLEPPRILIVDDAPDNIHLLADALEPEYIVLVAMDGQRALEIANRPEQPPDLILLDVMMPDMGGYEVCRQLKAMARTRDIPVIFVTARGAPEDEAKGLNLGAVDYISKPLHLPIVLARIRNHINLKLKSDLLDRLAKLDGLTNIANRRRFDEVLDLEWRRAVREGGSLSMIMLDVDCFKEFNDVYGHGEGDQCLRRVARAMRGALTRPGDLLARYGGEEFAAILPDTDLDGAHNIGERMRAAVQALDIRHQHNQTVDVVTVSVGCASVQPSPQMTDRGLIETADAMLYTAKKAGRNRVSARCYGLVE